MPEKNDIKLPEEFTAGMTYYCKKCIGGFICSIIASFIPLLALFSHELQNDPTSRIFYCVFAIGFYIFCIILSLVDLKHEKNVRALFPTKCKELGYIAIGISTVGIIVSIVLIVVSLL